MKVTVDRQSVCEEEGFKVGSIYEYHYKSEKPFIVMVSGEGADLGTFKGTVIYSENGHRSVGEAINCFLKHVFKPFKGKLTIEV